MAQTQAKDDTARATSHGPFAKYLEDENPNCPVDKLTERFQKWDKERRKASLPRLRFDGCCPECDTSDVFYTETFSVARCERCGLKIVDQEKAPRRVLEAWE